MSRRNRSFAEKDLGFATPVSHCPAAKAHKWRISEPNGNEKVPGTCHYCHETKLFTVGGDSLGDRTWSELRTVEFA